MTKPSYEERNRLSGLNYIANSPDEAHGGFHPTAIATAKSAIKEIETLRAELARVRGLLQRLSKAWEIDPQGETFISLLQELTDDEPIVQELCGDIRSGHTCDLPKGHTELHAENHGQIDELVWNHRPPNFPQSSSPAEPGAESADIGKLDTADKKHAMINTPRNFSLRIEDESGVEMGKVNRVDEDELKIVRVLRACGKTMNGGQFENFVTHIVIPLVEHHWLAGSAETGGEKAASQFSTDELNTIARIQACMDSVGEKWVHPERYSEYERNMGLLFAGEWDNGGSMSDCEFAEVIAAAVQRASTFRHSSQNQTASSGVEGAHEGTTADKSGASPELLPTQLPKGDL